MTHNILKCSTEPVFHKDKG